MQSAAELETVVGSPTQFTPPTRRNPTVLSRRRRRCEVAIKLKVTTCYVAHPAYAVVFIIFLVIYSIPIISTSIGQISTKFAAMVDL